MAVPPWVAMPQHIPDDEAVVWIRLRDWSGAPFLASYDASAQTFTSVVGGLVAPWHVVARWREQ